MNGGDYHLTRRPFVGMMQCHEDDGLVTHPDQWTVHVHFYPTDPGEELFERWSLLLVDSQAKGIDAAYKLVAENNPECPFGFECEGHDG